MQLSRGRIPGRSEIPQLRSWETIGRKSCRTTRRERRARAPSRIFYVEWLYRLIRETRFRLELDEVQMRQGHSPLLCSTRSIITSHRCPSVLAQSSAPTRSFPRSAREGDMRGQVPTEHFRITPASSNLRVLLRQLPRKVVEHTQLVVIQVGDSELAQTPRLILRL